MEKQKKQFLGMLLVLAVLAAAYGGIHVYNQKQEEKEGFSNTSFAFFN